MGFRRVESARRRDEAAVLARETARRMDDRLDYVRLQPQRIVHLGLETGEGLRLLRKRYPRALALALDPDLSMLAAMSGQSSWLERIRGRAALSMQADLARLPLADGSAGLAFSSLSLYRLDGPALLQAAFGELHRVLEVGGLLMFSTLGPDTLKELHAAGEKVGIGGTVRQFIDMHDIGDMLLAAGFADPVMDMEMIALTYSTPRELLSDQRHLAAKAALFRPLGFRAWRQVFKSWATTKGRLPASFEIVYGHAWKAAPRVPASGTVVRLTRR